MYHILKRYAGTVALSLFLSAGLLFAPTPAQGQVDVKPGVRIGFDSATLGGDTDQYVQAVADLGGGTGFDFSIDMGRRSGFMVGGFALLDLGGPLALQPELRYIQKGFGFDLTISFQGQSQTSSGSLNLAYLDLPVLARYQIPMSGAFSPHLIAGPRVGFNLSAESEVNVPNGGTQTQSVDNVSGTDFGFEFGAGVDYGLSAGTATLDLRYGIGLSNIVDAEGSDLSLSNRALMITAGFSF